MLSVEKQMLFLLSKADELETQDMIRIYEKRGYSAPYIRNGLSRLKKDRYVISPSRSAYRITEAGRTFIRTINRKPEHYTLSWDGCWHLVLTSFPETDRKRRDQLRADLLQTGFGQLHAGVYISPWPYREELGELLRKHEAEGYATVFAGRLEHGEAPRDIAAKVWPLADTAQMYEEKRRWFSEEFKPILLKAAGNATDDAKKLETDPLELFILYLELGEQINELYLIDPMLPEELLPEDWSAQRILRQLTECMAQIKAAIPHDSAYSRYVN
ncbi:PaaX family transcriptional regulator [Paenibacillus elgii]|uniref:PaaX family transcriptional regulator n=2 Tax=Paenibacillus elgii TaxID=189691 RepID=A0A2T6FUF7_9BACL|nr:PaaX family transcriptional regulator [Paenibacillus elgii]